MGGIYMQQHYSANHNVNGDVNTVDVCVGIVVDHISSSQGRIPCNGADERVPGGVICTGGFVIEVDWVVWYFIYII